MPLFGILFWLVLLAIYFFCGASLTIFVLGWWKKSRLLKWLGGIPLGFGILVGLCAAGLFAAGIYESHSAPHVFRNMMGFDPPPEVKPLRGYSTSFFDSANSYLSFQAPQEVIERIVKDRMNETSVDKIASTSDEPPEWWNPPRGSNVKIYAAEKWTGSFATEQAVLYYDAGTHMAWFEWFGID